MTKSEKKKLIGNHAATWSVAILASFILPFVGESMTDGRSHFIKVLMQIMPLMAALWFASVQLNKAIGEPTE